MLQKINVKLSCTAAGNITGHGGSELHGLLFKVVRAVDEKIARSLHDSDPKPFAIGPLRGRGSLKEGLMTLEKGSKYSFSLSALDKGMTDLLPEIEKYLQSEELRLGEASFRLEETKPLFKKPMPYFKLMAINAEEDLKVSFDSLTCFRRDGKLHLFPLPELILPGLVKRCEHFSGFTLPRLKPEAVLVLQHNIKTGLAGFTKYNLVGFKGFCKYGFTPGTLELDRWAVTLLFNFAAIAGAGYKTTMGMGQVRVHSNR